MKTLKTLILALIALIITGLCSCGPTAGERAAYESYRKDHKCTGVTTSLIKIYFSNGTIDTFTYTYTGKLQLWKNNLITVNSMHASFMNTILASNVNAFKIIDENYQEVEDTTNYDDLHERSQ